MSDWREGNDLRELHTASWMTNQTVGYLTLGGLVFVAIAMSWATNTVAGLDGKIAGLLTQSQPEAKAMTLTEDVDRGGGRTTTVTTTQLPDESQADCIARHDAAVALLKADG